MTMNKDGGGGEWENHNSVIIKKPKNNTTASFFLPQSGNLITVSLTKLARSSPCARSFAYTRSICAHRPKAPAVRATAARRLFHEFQVRSHVSTFALSISRSKGESS